MSEHIIEPNGDGRALVYPDVPNPSDDEKRVMTVEDVYDEFGQEEVELMFEGYEKMVEGETVIFSSAGFDVYIEWPFELRDYEVRKYKDGTGPIRQGYFLASNKGRIVTGDGTMLEKTKRFKREAEDRVESMDT